MQVQQFVVALNSAQPERLANFYKDVLGLEPCFEVAPGAFKAGSSSFAAMIVEGHSELEGPAREPQRFLVNFLVDDVPARQRDLEAKGVPFIAPAYEEPGVGTFATFADPDGNYCQLVHLEHA